MMALSLSDDKQMHLSHVILESLKNTAHAKLLGDQGQALREVKKVISEHMKVEAELDQHVRHRLQSYSRPIPEGSQEWDVLYHKTFEEELRKRKLG